MVSGGIGSSGYDDLAQEQMREGGRFGLVFSDGQPLSLSEQRPAVWIRGLPEKPVACAHAEAIWREPVSY
jgi:hypothetical protein